MTEINIKQLNVDGTIRIDEMAAYSFFDYHGIPLLITMFQDPDKYGRTVVAYNFASQDKLLFRPDDHVRPIKKIDLEYTV